MNLDQHTQTLLATHAELIRLAIAVRQDRDLAPALFEVLHNLEEDGWTNLVRGMIDFLEGRELDLARFDAEDRAILAAMQRGLAEPDFLAELEQAGQTLAAGPLAALVYAATQGESEALESLTTLRAAADTEAARASTQALVRMIEGERDPHALSQGLPEAQARLIQAVLSELVGLEKD